MYCTVYFAVNCTVYFVVYFTVFQSIVHIDVHVYIVSRILHIITWQYQHPHGHILITWSLGMRLYWRTKARHRTTRKTKSSGFSQSNQAILTKKHPGIVTIPFYGNTFLLWKYAFLFPFVVISDTLLAARPLRPDSAPCSNPNHVTHPMTQTVITWWPRRNWTRKNWRKSLKTRSGERPSLPNKRNRHVYVNHVILDHVIFIVVWFWLAVY